MNRYTITITYGKLLYTRELCAATIVAASLIARLSYPRASSITVESR